MKTPPESAGRPGFSLRRLAPLFVLIAGFVLFFAFDLDRHVSFRALEENREWLIDWVDRYGLLAGAVFAAVYAVAVAFSVPGGAVLTIASGFLFGPFEGTGYAVAGATFGATAVFLVARTALGEPLRARAGRNLRRMEEGFRRDAMSYLLFLRLVPVFPFWLVNLVPAFLGVPLRTYVIATFFGILPGTLVYASVGNGIGAVLEAGRTPDLGIIFQPEILLPILGLAVLALLPAVIRRVRARKTEQS